MHQKLCRAHVGNSDSWSTQGADLRSGGRNKTWGKIKDLFSLSHDHEFSVPIPYIMGEAPPNQLFCVCLPWENHWCSPSLGVIATPISKVKQWSWKPFQGRHKGPHRMMAWLRKSLWGVPLLFLRVKVSIKTLITGFQFPIWKERGRYYRSTKGYPASELLKGFLWCGSETWMAHGCISSRLRVVWGRVTAPSHRVEEREPLMHWLSGNSRQKTVLKTGSWNFHPSC